MAAAFERSETTTRLVNYCKAFDKGHRISYLELSRAVDEEITSTHQKLRYARYVLSRDHAQVWVTVQPRLGIVRLDDKQIAERFPKWWLNSAKRRLTEGRAEATIVEIDKLSLDEQTRFSVGNIQAQLALQALSKPTFRQLDKVARGSSNDLPTFNIVEWAFALTPKIKGSAPT